MRRLLALFILYSTISCSHVWAATPLTGTVVRVIDGDTLVLQTTGGATHRIRLSDIDAPEKRQPYGDQATLALTRWVTDQSVRVIIVDTDRYGRLVGRVYVGTVEVNAELVKAGAAWVYHRSLSTSPLHVLEAEAIANQRGLWGLPQSQHCPPWSWRKQLCH